MKFKIGQLVKWTSQAGSYRKTKHGKIAQIVTEGNQPSHDDFPQLFRGSGCGFGRKAESYVVLVGKKPYWPVASLLKPATCPDFNHERKYDVQNHD